MSSNDDYWDDPTVKAAEAAYKAAKKQAALDRKFEGVEAAKRRLEEVQREWLAKHPGRKPPWRHAMDEGKGEHRGGVNL